MFLLFAEPILAGELHASSGQGEVTLDALAPRICDLYVFTPDHLRSDSRRSRLVEARSPFCFWARRRTRFPAAAVVAFLPGPTKHLQNICRRIIIGR